MLYSISLTVRSKVSSAYTKQSVSLAIHELVSRDHVTFRLKLRQNNILFIDPMLMLDSLFSIGLGR